MKKIIVLFFIFALLAPAGVVFGLEPGGSEIDFERVSFDKLQSFSFEAGEAMNFLKKARDLGSKIYELISKIWGTASHFLESITGLTLSELFTGLINATIGIIETIIELLG